MRLSEDKVRRIAERVVDELEERGLVRYTTRESTGRALRVKQVYELLEADLKLEADIDDEVDRVLGTYSRTLKATEQDILRRKHKEEIAKRRNFEV
ncbi:MAG: DUF507 family protein [Herpetosiphon sp.]